MASRSHQTAGSPRFVAIALTLAGLLVLAAGGLLGYALHTRPNALLGVLSKTVGGPFQLVDQNGKPFTDADLKGKWHLVYFGFTHCADVCPTTLNNLSVALDRSGGKRRGEVGIVFITVDPRRDTPAVLKAYLQNFDGPIVALTGTPAEVKQAENAYHVYAAKPPNTDGDYDVDHSAVIYVMDPQGHFAGTLNPDDATEAIETKLHKLVS